MRPRSNPPLAAIFGCSGPRLSAAERTFFRDSDPVGFILFARNVETPDQVGGLVAALRESVGRADAPVLIDQEGGRVARLTAPHWRPGPPAAVFGQLAATDGEGACRAARLNAVLIGATLWAIGVTVDCAPVLDLRIAEAHDIIGDRAFSDDPETVARLGRAACDGFLEAGVLPVIKHIPGHGRAGADSHETLPVVEASLDALRRMDFSPFRALSDMPLAMTAHILYTAIDPVQPATTSRTVIADVIRGELGFDGLLLSDDIGMKALPGSFAERTRAVLDAGCDVVLHCSGDAAEMRHVADNAQPLTESAARRLERALQRIAAPVAVDTAAARRDLDKMLESIEA